MSALPNITRVEGLNTKQIMLALRAASANNLLAGKENIKAALVDSSLAQSLTEIKTPTRDIFDTVVSIQTIIEKAPKAPANMLFSTQLTDLRRLAEQLTQEQERTKAEFETFIEQQNQSLLALLASKVSKQSILDKLQTLRNESQQWQTRIRETTTKLFKLRTNLKDLHFQAEPNKALFTKAGEMPAPKPE